MEPWIEPIAQRVGDVHRRIAERFSAMFPERIMVAGKVRDPRFGEDRLSFEIAESSDDKRAIHVVLGPQDLPRVSQAQWPDELENVLAEGQMLVLTGRLQYWAEGHRPQIVLDAVDRDATLAARVEERTEIRHRLQEEGLYGHQAAGAKLRLAPLRVAVIGEDRSQVEDTIAALTGSGFAVAVKAHPTSLAGRGAAAQLASVIEGVATSGVDLILLVHGPGSDFRLAPFDSEAVARTVARSRVPILTGIIRSGDRTLTDEVAYQALATPGAAAAFVVGRLRAAHAELARARRTVEMAHQVAKDRLRENRQRKLAMLATALATVLAAVSTVYAIRPHLFPVAVFLALLAGLGGGLLWRSRNPRAVQAYAPARSIPQLDFETSMSELERIVAWLAQARGGRQLAELMMSAGQIENHCARLLGAGS